MITSSPSREQQISNAQSRLLALLDGATPAAVADAPSSKCPKCHAPDFHSGTWCGDCGYFPKAGFEGDGPANQEVEAGELDIWQLIPGWCWLLFAVELTMIVGSFVFSVSIGEHWARTLVSISVLAFCGMLMLVTHVRAYFRTLSGTHSLGTFDMIMKPTTIWRETLRGLPESSFLVCSMVWGMTGVLVSVLVIGGLDYMSIHQFVARDEPLDLPSAADVAGVVVKGAAAMPADDDPEAMQSMLGTLNEAANDPSQGGGNSPQDLQGAIGQFADSSQVSEDANSDSGTTSESNMAAAYPSVDDETTSDADSSNDEPASTTNESTTAGESSESESSDAPAAAADSSPGEQSSESLTQQSSDATPSTTATRCIEQLPPGEVVTCAIVGYTVNSASEPRSLLLAARVAGEWRYIARLSIDDVPSEIVTELRSAFPSHLSPRPLVACPFGGQWLTPDFFCEIHFPHSATGLRLTEPTFVGLSELP